VTEWEIIIIIMIIIIIRRISILINEKLDMLIILDMVNFNYECQG
jgi:hypothetical protein